MSRRDVRSLAPRWVRGIVGGLPGAAAVVTLIVMNLTGHNRLFNLSPKDSFLVAELFSILIGAVVSLFIWCMILMRALPARS